MARLVFAPQAAQDLKRLTEFLLDADPDAANETIGILIDGLNILKQHPLVGRNIEQGYRELVISRGRTGYVALYAYDKTRNVALILAIRHQRESGFID
ncbi:MAG: type II toxin-antitoxin system RelE/ParE family toxin [Nitrosomonadales bacterium]|nr:type II toxin-antitoxin system RelE/ParE family toxin [Nitrosomonadales bacterium]